MVVLLSGRKLGIFIVKNGIKIPSYCICVTEMISFGLC
jgi:hypothetical protein